MRKILPNQVCLNITTFRGCVGATHYYGRLREYNGEWIEEDLRVNHPLTAKQAAFINVTDGMVGKPYAYEEGEMSERFDDEDAVKEAAIAQAREKWGDDVEIYLGRPTRALEDLERLV